jgi:hypothetical protein
MGSCSVVATSASYDIVEDEMEDMIDSRSAGHGCLIGSLVTMVTNVWKTECRLPQNSIMSSRRELTSARDCPKDARASSPPERPDI